jgi:predicted DNA-binding transcriptional regulator AlpA
MPKDKMLRIDDAMKELNVSEKTIYNLIERGVLRKFKRLTGNPRVFVSAEDVARAKEIVEEQ